MFLCRILAILLTSSPITIYVSDIYFPYSFLGMTLFFLTSIFFPKDYFPIVDFLFWAFSILAIISNKPISYQFILHTFVVYQYFLLSVQMPKMNYLLFVGIVLHFVSVFVPVALIANIILLAFIMLIYYLTTRKKYKFTKNTKNLQKPTLENYEELEYVIPSQDDE